MRRMVLSAWAEFLAALAVFFASHAIPARPAVKQRLVGLLGRGAYGACYGIISLAALGWVIAAAGRAPTVALAPVAPWQLAAPFILMVPACLLVAFALFRPNPYSFGGSRNARFNPSYPGVVRITRHPLLLAILLWAVGHLLANPHAAHAILFGSFAVFSLTGMAAIDRRLRRNGIAMAGEPIPPMGVMELTLRAAGGLALYALVLLAHPVVAGINVYILLPSLIRSLL
ncbi:MAG: NnrU family protein [Pseudomonadota bacterium]